MTGSGSITAVALFDLWKQKDDTVERGRLKKTSVACSSFLFDLAPHY